MIIDSTSSYITVSQSIAKFCIKDYFVKHSLWICYRNICCIKVVIFGKFLINCLIRIIIKMNVIWPCLRLSIYNICFTWTFFSNIKPYHTIFFH